MDRISKKGLTLTRQVFPLILNPISWSELYTVQKEEDDISEEVTSAIDMALEYALDTIDRAILALHLSSNTSDCVERIRLAEQALDGFAAALSTLDQVEDEVRATETWQVWYEEVLKGIASSRELLEE